MEPMTPVLTGRDILPPQGTVPHLTAATTMEAVASTMEAVATTMGAVATTNGVNEMRKKSITWFRELLQDQRDTLKQE